MQQIYKNLYFDDEQACYMFVNGNDKRLVVDQQSYLLIYILEVLSKMNAKQPEVFNLNGRN